MTTQMASPLVFVEDLAVAADAAFKAGALAMQSAIAKAFTERKLYSWALFVVQQQLPELPEWMLADDC